MITFEKTGEEMPYDILVKTDDHDGELATLQDCFTQADALDMEAARNLAACTLADGEASFLIPAIEATDAADVLDGEFPALGDLIEELNAQHLADLQAKQHRGA